MELEINNALVEQAEAQKRAFANWLFAQSIEFMRGVASLDDLPPLGLPEVAFVGRSNVGKSSLINALTGRKALARTSHTPGRTQQLNFFQVASHLIVVDLPGYGYAKVSKAQVNAWTELLKLYLRGRSTLKRVYVLIDSRHGIKTSDVEIMDMLDEAGVSYQLVLTKVDKIKPPKLKQAIESIEAVLSRHTAAHPEILATSAHEKDGVDDLKITTSTLALKLDSSK